MLVDSNGVSCFVDSNGVSCWTDSNGLELCCEMIIRLVYRKI